MNAKRIAILDVLLASLAVHQDDADREFPASLHAEVVSAMVDQLVEKPQPSGWLGIADYICHSPYRRPS